MMPLKTRLIDLPVARGAALAALTILLLCGNTRGDECIIPVYAKVQGDDVGVVSSYVITDLRARRA